MSTKQALMREVNDRIWELNTVFRVTTGSCVVLCECGASDCFERIVVPIETYENLRDQQSVLVAPGHGESAAA